MTKVFRKTNNRLGRILIGTILTIVVWVFCASLAARALIVNAPLNRADALVVFSGSSAYVERVQLAAKLFSERRATRVVLTNDGVPSGWSEERQRNPFFVERGRDDLLRAGVPADRIEVLPGIVGSTYDEAVAARQYAEQKNQHSLLFVTSAYHTRRALWTLRHVFDSSGIEVGIESVQPGIQTPRAATWWLSSRGWKIVALEYPKIVYYYFKHG